MQLLSLNTWGGTVYQPLMDYIKKQSESTDIFCFQEVFKHVSAQTPIKAEDARLHLYEELDNLLENFIGCFVGTSQGHTLTGPVNYPTEMGQAIFVKNNIQVLKSDAYPIFGNYHDTIKPDFSNIPRGLQHVQLDVAGKSLHIFNYHGIPKPGDKLDSPERLEQSRKIITVLKNITGPKILCGDFNLNPETKSIGLLEQEMRNLIKEFHIKSTRNRISWENHKNIQYFADYIFISSDIQVKNFQVPYYEISDHLPMFMEFDL